MLPSAVRSGGEGHMLDTLDRRVGWLSVGGRSTVRLALAAAIALEHVIAAISLKPAIAAGPDGPAAATDRIALSIDAAKAGARFDRNLFGQLAEHLGTGIYEGVWVGRDSRIPNTRGIRNDVVAALRALKVPNVRWPGGCFADEYHWRKGIGPNRPATLNPNWGGVIEPNSFG